MNIAITGGAGYIGSHTSRLLLDSNETVVIIDSLETGHRKAVDSRAIFYEADIRDNEEITKILLKHNIDGVIHFAANSLVGESMENPLKYYEKNVYGTQKLLQAILDTGVKNIVFSSTAAVYGEPESIPIKEDDPKNPTNTYGETKLAMEKMIHWVSQSSSLKYVSLRYFNVAGAWDDGSTGEAHSTETHLIPIIIQVPLGKRKNLQVYGNDYPTKDGSCIRDYIHVVDLAEAHYLAMKHLFEGGNSEVFNLGSQEGYSVLEMIDAAEKVVGSKIPYELSSRRAGDPAILVASSQKINKALGWKPIRTELKEIIGSAYAWHRLHPEGFKD